MIPKDESAKEYHSSYEHVYVVGDGDGLCARFHALRPFGDEVHTGYGSTDAEAIADLANNTLTALVGLVECMKITTECVKIATQRK